jgi:hypothetical protein
MLNNEDLLFYNRYGYTTVKNSINDSDLIYLRDKFRSLYLQARDVRSVIPVRCYDDYPYFLSKGVNIATIENPAQYLSSEVANTFNRSNIAGMASLILGRSVSLKLYRVHVTNRFSHEGPWHRDTHLTEDDSDILCNVYLEDEFGMRFFDKTQPIHFDNKIYFDGKINDLDFNVLRAKAGDVVFFDPKLIHKPFCHNYRMHIHFRFTSIFEESNRMDFLNYVNSNNFYKRSRGVVSSIKRIVRFLKGFIK